MNGRNFSKKRLVAGITIMLVGITLLPTIGSLEIEKHVSADNGGFSAGFNRNGNTIYVDDDNTQGPWDGTLDHPYQYIQDGIDNALANDTVFVFNGSYFENVVVNTTIKLIGENQTNTVIDGGNTGDVVIVTAPTVNISGFTIQNSGSSGYPDYDAGVYIDESRDIVISGNIIKCNGAHGIQIYGHSYHYTISENTITENNNSGIYLEYAYSLPVGIISGNIINNNDYGIYISNSRWFIVFNNTIADNIRDGIYSPFMAAHYQIFNNNIINNGECGIHLEMSAAYIFSNNIINNGEYGIFLYSPHDPYIYHNNFINIQNAMIQYYDETNLDNGYPSGGNYWSDFHNESQGAYDNNSDNIVDDPYIINVNSQDRFPLIHPWNGTVLTKPKCGDVNKDGSLNAADVVYLINYLFINGPEPKPALCIGDCNGDGSVDIADVVYFINYLFVGGPAPDGCCESVVCGDIDDDGLIKWFDVDFLGFYLTGVGPAPDPLCRGDANGDGFVDYEDYNFLIDYLLYGGPAPVEDCCG